MGTDQSKARELGGVVAELVFHEVPKLKERQMDEWLIILCSGLFSTLFEAMPIMGRCVKEESHLEDATDAFLSAAVHRANELTIRTLHKRTSIFRPSRISYDFTGRIQADLVACFNYAADAEEERGYDLPAARSHAVYCYITAACKALVLNGTFDARRFSERAYFRFIKGAYDFGDSMANLARLYFDL